MKKIIPALAAAVCASVIASPASAATSVERHCHNLTVKTTVGSMPFKNKVCISLKYRPTSTSKGVWGTPTIYASSSFGAVLSMGGGTSNIYTYAHTADGNYEPTAVDLHSHRLNDNNNTHWNISQGIRHHNRMTVDVPMHVHMAAGSAYYDQNTTFHFAVYR